ncbi:hypothetical protein [Methylobacterium sp. WL64]|uniref:hypothetical protein n=1 Tax=Methylobacterium sp. WL64 TaxID=2603894 RepID=UPI00164F62B1|nr:hypothetical protein [Methylobacterium sp. WL64]
MPDDLFAAAIPPAGIAARALSGAIEVCEEGAIFSNGSKASRPVPSTSRRHDNRGVL